MRKILAFALLAGTALSPAARADEAAPMPSVDQMRAALSVPNAQLTASYKQYTTAATAAHAAGGCPAAAPGAGLSAAMLNCPTRGIHDVRTTVPQAPPPAPPVAPGVTADSSCAAGSGICAIPIQFATNSAELTPEALDHLDKVASALGGGSTALRLLVEGHTDTTGSPGVNLPLSQRRANAAAQYLAHRAGVTMNQMIVTGVGDTRPIVPTGAQVDEPRNRVVVIGRIGA